MFARPVLQHFVVRFHAAILLYLACVETSSRGFSALQERAQSAVTVMEQSSRQAHTSVAHAEEAATALDGIGQRVNEITDMNAQIATAVEQQRAVSEDINRSIINIRDAADTNVQTGQNNLQSAKSVAQLTSALSELAKQFWEKRG